MKRTARVVDLQSGRGVLLEFDRVSPCLRCQRGAGCGSGLFSNGRSAPQLWFRADNHERYSVGQAVVVNTENGGSGWLAFVLVCFGLPLSGMILATLIATWITTGFDSSLGASGLAYTSKADELAILCSAIVGLAAGIFLWTRLPDKLSRDAESSLCLQSARIQSVTEHRDTNEMHDEKTL